MVRGRRDAALLFVLRLAQQIRQLGDIHLRASSLLSNLAADPNQHDHILLPSPWSVLTTFRIYLTSAFALLRVFMRPLGIHR
jgi:hypothetical protein